MKLIDVLKEIKDNSNKYAMPKDMSKFGYRYKNGKCMIFDYYNMKYYKIGEEFYFTEKELFSDDWNVRIIVTPKYKMGDRFLLPDLCSENVQMDKTVSTTIFNNTMREIIASYYDGEKVRYTVSLNGNGFPLLLTEDYLNELDMVVSQK